MTVAAASSIGGLIAAALAVVTIVIANRRGYGFIVPIRLVATAVASLTSLWWAPKIVEMFPPGVLDEGGTNVVTAGSILMVALAISPTPRQIRAFFFGEADND